MMGRPVIGDDLLLEMVRARVRGVSTRDMAARLRMPEVRIRVATNRVKAADPAESGECPDAVGAAYWRDGRTKHAK